MALRKSTRQDYEQRLARAEQWIASHLDEEISPSAAARAASFSLHHFHRIFRAQRGESLMQHVRRLKLERAARRLRQGTPRILDVALEAGYDSHEAFTRAFAEYFGLPPSSYRTEPSPRLQRRTPATPRITVDVRKIEPIPIVYRRHRGSYMGVSPFWDALMSWTSQHHELTPPRYFGLCPDDPEVTPEPHLRFDACVEAPRGLMLDASVTRAEIPGGTYAVGVHVGPFERLADTYLAVIGDWFPSSGYEPDVLPVVEHYLDDPTVTPPEALRTEVRVRIAEAP